MKSFRNVKNENLNIKKNEKAKQMPHFRREMLDKYSSYLSWYLNARQERGGEQKMVLPKQGM